MVALFGKILALLKSKQFPTLPDASCHSWHKMNTTIISDIFQSFKYLFTFIGKWKKIYISIGLFCLIVIIITTALSALIINMVKLFPVLYENLLRKLFLVIVFSGSCSIWLYLKFGINSKNKKERPPTQADEDIKPCIICYSEDRQMILKPCNHICLCQNCCTRIIQDSNKCPFCQSRIIKSERIYLP